MGDARKGGIRMTSRNSGLGNSPSGQQFTETGKAEIDTGEKGQVRNQKPSEECVLLDNNITTKSKLKCMRSGVITIWGTGKVNDTSLLPERTRQRVVFVFL